jgi:poly(A) polymerase
MLDNYEFLLRKREEFANEPIIPPPLLRGHDLIALGFKPGPEFSEILEAVETRQLEGGLRNTDEALEWVKKRYLSGKQNQENVK